MIKKLIFFIFLFTASIIIDGCRNSKESYDFGIEIKAYNLDFNWGEVGINNFAKPGLWANASPEDQVKWYKDLGVNTIQTSCISCNGYAWYKNGIVPEQPGLVFDFLPEIVRLGHESGMKVMGYFCIGSNTRWGLENPDYSYGCPNEIHIPFTRKYLEYLDAVIRDALTKTNMDGFMIDWFYQPKRISTKGQWINSEIQRYEELMGKTFPGVENLSETDYNSYSRLAIEKCWEVIHKAAKETNPNCIIWLTCFDITHPHIINSKMFKEVDWLMNEAGDINSIDTIKSMIGQNTRLITCLANWNGQDAESVTNEAIKKGVGLYGFAKPNENSLLPSLDYFLSSPIESFSGDERNIATFARVFNNLPVNFIEKEKVPDYKK
jgi:hypothetical protein